jgi:hypothetical protein
MTLSFCHPRKGRGSALDRVSPWLAQRVDVDKVITTGNHKFHVFSTSYMLSFQVLSDEKIAPKPINIYC